MTRAGAKTTTTEFNPGYTCDPRDLTDAMDAAPIGSTVTFKHWNGRTVTRTKTGTEWATAWGGRNSLDAVAGQADVVTLTTEDTDADTDTDTPLTVEKIESADTEHGDRGVQSRKPARWGVFRGTTLIAELLAEPSGFMDRQTWRVVALDSSGGVARIVKRIWRGGRKAAASWALENLTSYTPKEAA